MCHVYYLILSHILFCTVRYNLWIICCNIKFLIAKVIPENDNFTYAARIYVLRARKTKFIRNLSLYNARQTSIALYYQAEEERERQKAKERVSFARWTSSAKMRGPPPPPPHRPRFCLANVETRVKWLNWTTPLWCLPHAVVRIPSCHATA